MFILSPTLTEGSQERKPVRVPFCKRSWSRCHGILESLCPFFLLHFHFVRLRGIWIWLEMSFVFEKSSISCQNFNNLYYFCVTFPSNFYLNPLLTDQLMHLKSYTKYQLIKLVFPTISDLSSLCPIFQSMYGV